MATITELIEEFGEFLRSNPDNAFVNSTRTRYNARPAIVYSSRNRKVYSGKLSRKSYGSKGHKIK